MPKLWNSGLVLLPDDKQSVPAAAGVGIVELLGAACFDRAADAIHGKDGRGGDVLAVCRPTQVEQASWRGLVAAALLLDTWREDVAVRTMRVTPAMTGLVGAVMTAADRDELDLVVLQKGDRRAILGVADPTLIVAPAASPENLDLLLPQRMTWYRDGVFSDPTDLLNQRDRRTLEKRLRAVGGGAEAMAFADALHAADEREDLDDDWLIRMKAVVSLSQEEQYARLLTASIEPYALGTPDNPVLAALKIVEHPNLRSPEQRIYAWNGTPFARSNARIGVEPVHLSGEEEALTAIREELTQLEGRSIRYQRETGERLERYMPGLSTEFSRAARLRLGDWQQEARESSRRAPETLELTWPWEQESPAVRTLLDEVLGGQLTGAALCAFPDRLALMNGASMNDALLDQVCSVMLGDVRWTSLVPVSDTMAEYIARFGWAGGGLIPDCIRLTADADENVTVTLMLAGRGNVRLNRTYTKEEQLRWSEITVPEISMWPSVPMERASWKSYFVSVRGQAEISLLRGGQWLAGNPGDVFMHCAVTQTDEFPGCVSLRRDGESLGALWYTAQIYHPETKGKAVAALDLGASGISMAVSINGQPQGVEMPSLWRLMLQGSRVDLPGEILPVWPLPAVLPAAVAMSSGSVDPIPFVDGRIVTPVGMEDKGVRDGVFYDLLWRTDEPGRRARRLALREAMLLTAFHAVMMGADSVSWRVTLPVGMAEQARAELVSEVRELADVIRAETGVAQWGPAPEGVSGSHAAGTYLRENGLIRDSFILLDVGASSSSGSLWLRGTERPVMSFALSSGVRAMAVPGMMDRPDKLMTDFGALPDLHIEELANAMDTAQNSLNDWVHANLLLDRLLGDQLPVTMPWMNQCCADMHMTYTQALLVLGFAQTMTVTGMMLEKVFRSPLINDRLPQELQLILCGRGAQVMIAMDETLRYQLMRFVRLPMSNEHTVRSIRLAATGLTRMEAVLGLAGLPGLPRSEEAPTGPKLGPTDLLAKYFLLQFRACFPQATNLLFPGMFGPGGMFSPAAENVVNAASAQPVGTEEAAFMNVIAAVRQSFSGIVE